MKCCDVNSTDGASSVTSSELLRAAQACDPDAWRDLVNGYSRRMYRWSRLAGLQPADAANVVQEAFTSVARKLADYRHDCPGATFRGWLRRIVDNKICDHHRRQGRQLDVSVGGSDAQRRLADLEGPKEGASVSAGSSALPNMTPGQLAVAKILAAVRGAVGQRDWKVFWRVAVDGQSAVDVGQEHGMSANAVRLVKMRVLRRLRERLSEQSLKPQE